jgi:hypothetical protein
VQLGAGSLGLLLKSLPQARVGRHAAADAKGPQAGLVERQKGLADQTIDDTARPFSNR